MVDSIASVGMSRSGKGSKGGSSGGLREYRKMTEQQPEATMPSAVAAPAAAPAQVSWAARAAAASAAGAGSASTAARELAAKVDMAGWKTAGVAGRRQRRRARTIGVAALPRWALVKQVCPLTRPAQAAAGAEPRDELRPMPVGAEPRVDAAASQSEQPKQQPAL